MRTVHAHSGAVDLGPYRHYMQKEIFEQPRAIAVDHRLAVFLDGLCQIVIGACRGGLAHCDAHHCQPGEYPANTCHFPAIHFFHSTPLTLSVQTIAQSN